MSEDQSQSGKIGEGSGPSATAHLVTVVVGPEVRQFRNCLIEIVPSLGVVNIWRAEPRRHVATAPLAATLIEWEPPQDAMDLDDSIW